MYSPDVFPVMARWECAIEGDDRGGFD
ncbi:MAG: hypothetical protein J07HX5_00670, partial [halophilic archaeon J07HX5]